jgi:hypothetical protein
VVDQRKGNPPVSNRPKIGDSNAKIPIRRAWHCLVETASGEQHGQPDEQIRALDARVVREKVISNQARGSLDEDRLVTGRLDPAEVSRDEIEVVDVCGGDAFLEV